MVSSHRGVGKADPAASRRASAAALFPKGGRAMADVNMPKLSDTMEEGTIVEWKKKTGDQVKTGEVLAEVESDKATFDLEAEADGTLQILVEQGVPAKIGAPIARIGDGSATTPAPVPAPQQKPKAAEPKAEVEKPEAAAAPAPAAPPAPPPVPPRERGGDDGTVRASPLARRLAEEMGVDLASLKG